VGDDEEEEDGGGGEIEKGGGEEGRPGATQPKAPWVGILAASDYDTLTGVCVV